jgi:GST-like protein
MDCTPRATSDFPNLKRWFETMQRSDAVKQAYAVAKTINTAPTVTEESKSILFGPGRPR